MSLYIMSFYLLPHVDTLLFVFGSDSLMLPLCSDCPCHATPPSVCFPLLTWVLTPGARLSPCIHSCLTLCGLRQATPGHSLWGGLPHPPAPWVLAPGHPPNRQPSHPAQTDMPARPVLCRRLLTFNFIF